MNSFNHYAYGAVGDWMYQVVAGLDIDPRDTGIQAHPYSTAAWRRTDSCKSESRNDVWKSHVGLGDQERSFQSDG